MKPMSYDSFAGPAAIGAGLAGLVYAVAFVLLENNALAGAALVVGGLLTSASLVAVYEQMRALDPTWTQRGVIMAVTGAAGAIIHGGYDLANALNPPPGDPNAANLPSQVDPRGILTFFMLGLGVGVLTWLMQRSGIFPAALVYLGYGFTALLILTYLARLVILDASSLLVLIPAALTGFLVQPAWFLWLGLVILGTRNAPAGAGSN
jgi:hypothetical protein